MITQELNRGWCIRPCTRGDWEIKTNVPCSVLHAMLEAKLAPDPFYRKNEYEVRELFDQNFCYTLRFVPQKRFWSSSMRNWCSTGWIPWPISG